MNKTNSLTDQIKLGLGIVLVAILTGCMGGYVDGGYGGYGDYGGYDEGPAPDLYLFGGDYEGGRDVHAYSQRGSASRGVAHSGGGHVGAAHGGGGHGGGHGGRR